MFDTLLGSFPLVQPILDADREVVAGRDVYDDDYFEVMLETTRPILERRLSESITGIATVIVDAWVKAGRPAVPVDAARTPRKVRRQ